MAAAENHNSAEAVAIVGMAGRFPGANNIHEFWRNLQNGVESIRFFSDAELRAAGVDVDEIRNDPAYVKARGILSDPGPEWFDAAFFGIQPKEAEVMDPQQRLFLETAWEALESAGCDPEKYPGVIGVFAGMTKSSYFLNHLLGRAELAAQAGDSLIFMGNDKDYLTTRVSYKLNLKGPSINISNACSTSLVAVCQAWQSLLNYQCDMALAGGVSISVPQERGYYFQEGNIASPDGHCRAFDANAQGTLFSNGVGIVVLKRLSDALNDGDPIWAVIKGAAVNNDGAAKVSFAAPSVDGQAEVITLAQVIAGVDAATISYVEAHGTATPLGDPIEIAGLTQAFRALTDGRNFCAVGSVKSNVGHLDVASGIAGLIKTTLALWHKQLVPSLHFEKPNPKIDFANSPFYVNSKLTPWTQGNTPRRAGVSSFGTGSTNAHVILEEAPPTHGGAPARRAQLLVLSARSAAALEQAASNLAQHLNSRPELDLADVAYTLQTGRRGFACRRALVCRDRGEAVASLVKPGPKREPVGTTPSVAFMFPGQGAQYVNMARGLYDEKGVFYRELNQCADLLKPRIGLDIRDVLYPNKDPSDGPAGINETLVTQPALFAVEYALAQQWQYWGIRPAALMGHSLGEYVAACVAGVLSRDDALMLLAERARLMQSLPPGAMLAVRLSHETLAPRLNRELSIAAINSPVLTMIAGPRDAIGAFEKQLAAEKIVCKRLGTSHAFHSAMLEPILKPYGEIVRRVKFAAPQIPWVSSLTGAWVDASQPMSAEYWGQQMRRPVRFADALSTLTGAASTHLLEVGPGRALATFARQRVAREAKLEVLTSLDNQGKGDRDLESLLHALGCLWSAGAAVDWPAVHDQQRRRRVPLPTYPFERKYFWVALPGKEKDTEVTRKAAGGARREENNQSPAAGLLGASRAEAKKALMDRHTLESLDSASHRQRILDQLQSLFSEVSGISLDALQPTVSFLDLGLDSLILTQMSSAIQKKFAVKVKFRQLLEDLSNLEVLADYLTRLIPAPQTAGANGRADVSQGAPIAATQMIPTGELAKVNAPALETVERLFARQLDLMQQQLDMLRGGVAQSQARSHGAEPSAALSAPAAMLGREANAPLASEPRGFGPYRPVNKGAGAALTARQTEALDRLTARYTAKTKKSKELTAAHRTHLADPRAVSGFRSLWKELVYPIVTERSAGSKLWDIDGNEYIDITSGFGAIFFGHSPDFVTDALKEQLKLGIEIGPQSPLAGKVAKLLCELTGMERAAFCNTGSEAVLAAIRIARTVSRRDKIATFSGDYHGIFDEVVVRGANRGDEIRSLPAAPGIPASACQNIIVLDHDDPHCLDILRAHAHELAAVIVEPVQGRRVDYQPRELLQQMRELTSECGAALIFDEVITGFRTHLGGMQAVYDIRADIATYGKVIGGGFPIGVVAGKADYMDALDGGAWSFGDDSAPEIGMTYFAGTFVRHPLALAAAWACLNYLKAQGPQLQESVNQRTQRLVESLRAAASAAQIPLRIPHYSSIFAVEFPLEWPHANLFYVYMRDKGIHIWEGRSWILTTAHTDQDVERIVSAFKESLAEMQAAGFLPAAQSGGSFQRTVPTRDAAARFPLTDGQREIWLAAQLSDQASLAFSDTILLRLRGRLDCQALIGAINELIARHEVLRAVFDGEGREATIAAEANITVPVDDLSEIAESGRAQQLEALARQDNQKPFALDRAPLLRARIVKYAAQDHTLVLTTHHIAVDGSSHGVLFAELGRIYSAYCADAAHQLPRAPEFSEYARWQQSAAHGDDEAYWLAQFAEPVPPLDLPMDRPRSGARSYHGAQQRLVLPADLCADLRGFTARQRTTLFVTLLASFNILLHRLSGQTDFVVGIAAAGQLPFEQPDLVGHCVNFLPLRNRVDPQTTVTNYCATVRAQVLDAYEHQNSTYGALLEKLKLPRDAGRPPLVAVSFNLDRLTSTFSFAQIEADLAVLPRCASTFDAEINVVESGEKIAIEWQYREDLFDASTVARMLGHWRTLLAAMVTDPGQPIGVLPLLTPAERHLFSLWNDTKAAYPSDQCVHQLFELQAQQTPEAAAVIFAERRLTYREVNERANQLAHYLIEQGVGDESAVALCMERSPEVVIGLLAILKAGGVYVPLDPHYPQERLKFMIDDAQVNILLTKEALACNLPAQHRAHMVCVDRDWPAIAKFSAATPQNHSAPDDLAYIIYTSGSTGVPKGVLGHHRGLVNRFHWMWQRYPFAAGEIGCQKTSLSFVDSLWELLGPLLRGVPTVVLPDAQTKDPEQLIAHLARANVSRIVLVPSLLRAMLEFAPDLQERLPRLRFWVSSGEALTSDLVQGFKRGLPGGRLINLYGSSEVAADVTYWEATAADAGLVSIGRPIANTQVYIVDDYLTPVPVGVPGMLYIGGAGVARGYHRRDDLTAERFILHSFDGGPPQRLFKTGDRASYRPDGNIEYLGRADYQIKIRGYRIELGEIEAVLRQHGGVRQSVVLAANGPDETQRLVAYVVAGSDSVPTIDELRRYLKTQLPDYMVPAAFVLLDALPLTPNGKLDVKALPAPEAQAVHPEANYHGARTDIEQRLAEIWAKVLKVETVGIHDNFFDLGGHSLLAVRLFSEIARTLNKRLPLAKVFDCPTIAQLAPFLAEESRPLGPSVIPIQPKGFKPPFFLVDAVYAYTRLAPHLDLDQPVYGLADYLGGEKIAYQSIEERAARYIVEMRQVQPKGPYHIGGHSLGALVAFEIAKQLNDQGEELALVVLMDPMPPGGDTQTRPAVGGRIRQHKDNLAKIGFREKVEYLRKWLQVEYLVKVLNPAKRLLCDLHHRLGRALAPELLHFYVYEVFYPEMYYPSSVNYQPSAYPGSVVCLFSQAQRSPTRLWQNLVGGKFEVHRVSGDHLDMLFEPNVRNTVDIVKCCLARAQAGEYLASGQARSGEQRGQALKVIPSVSKAIGGQRRSKGNGLRQVLEQ